MASTHYLTDTKSNTTPFSSDPTKVSNKFNDFFLNIAEKLSDKIENKSTKPQDYLKNPNKSRFTLKETIPDDVRKVVNQLDSKKSGDIYNSAFHLLFETCLPIWPIMQEAFQAALWLNG